MIVGNSGSFLHGLSIFYEKIETQFWILNLFVAVFILTQSPSFFFPTSLLTSFLPNVRFPSFLR